MEKEIRQLPLPFDTLPHMINRMIGSYLLYDDRINFSRVLTSIEDKYVKKIDSDSHNFAVKANLFRHKLDKFYEQPYNSVGRIKSMKRMFLYLLHTNDTCLFTKTHKEFRDVMRSRALMFTNTIAYGDYLYNNYRRDVKSLIRVSEKLLSYVDTLPPPKDNFDPAVFVNIE